MERIVIMKSLKRNIIIGIFTGINRWRIYCSYEIKRRV